MPAGSTRPRVSQRAPRRFWDVRRQQTTFAHLANAGPHRQQFSVACAVFSIVRSVPKLVRELALVGKV